MLLINLVLQIFYLLMLGIFPSILCCFTVGLLFPVRKEWYRKVILLLGCFLLVGMVIFIGDLANLPPTFLFFLFAVYFSCEGSFSKKIALGLMLCTTAFSYNALLDNYFTVNMPIYADVLLKGIFWLIVYLLIRVLFKEKTFELSKTYWNLIILLTLTPLGILFCVILMTNTSMIETTKYYDVYLVLLLLSLFSLGGLLYAVTTLAQAEKIREENFLLDMNMNYYKNMEQQQFEIRRLRHDMANHLQTLSTLPDDQMRPYLQSLLADKAFTNVVTYCGDSIINAVLNTKLPIIQEKKISFQHQIDISASLPYPPADLCALFANGLDNAIEAVMKLPPQDRQITLTAKAAKGLLVIQIKNPLSQGLNTDLPISAFKTTKKDASSHGYGLKSISEIVTRFNGSMEITTKDHAFCLFLYLPLNN